MDEPDPPPIRLRRVLGAISLSVVALVWLSPVEGRAQIVSGQTVSGQTVSGQTVSGQTASSQAAPAQTGWGQTASGQAAPVAAPRAPAPVAPVSPQPTGTSVQGGGAIGSPRFVLTPAPLPLAGAPSMPVGGVVAAAAPVMVPALAASSIDPQTQALDAVAKSLDQLKAQSSASRTEESLAQLRDQAARAQSSAETYVDARTRELDAVDARLRTFSTRSGAPRANLTAAERRERETLLQRRRKLEGELNAARQIGSAANRTYDDISNRSRTTFTDKIFERTASPLEEGFWTSLSASLQSDEVRVRRVVGDAVETATKAPEPRGVLSFALSLLMALVLALPVRRLLERLSARWRRGHDQPSEFGRTAHAVALVLIDTALPGAAVLVLDLGLSWGELLSERAAALAQALVIAVFWGAAILALSRQLAGSTDPDERLLPVSERLAARMKALPMLAATITGAGFVLSRANNVLGASLAATIATNCLVSLAYAGVASLVLVAISAGAPERDEAASEEPAKEPAEPRVSPARALLSLVLTTAIVVTIGAVFAGFTTLAALISRQVFWIAVLIAATYLLLRFVDSGLGLLFKPHGLLGRALIAMLGLPVATMQQVGVLTSALVQILIVLGAIALALTPFGRNGEMLSFHSLDLSAAIHLGSLTVSPVSIGTGALILLLGLGLSHIVERWVDRRYLPVTGWDIGVRTSVSTGVRYLGIGLAVLWALAAAGLGFKQVALVASALSVGIGFGLQQIVQNFVSGIILLIERPVKVGDWVNLAGVEGDVRRIRVRATEIETFDRTTLIVPNSDLITKQVQNKTLGDPYGRAQLKFTIGAARDAPRASAVVQALLEAEPDVLKEPAPVVLIDAITDSGAVNYSCFAYVESPRSAARVRSLLYQRLIEALADARIGFVGGPTTVVMQPSPELNALIDKLASRPGGDGEDEAKS